MRLIHDAFFANSNKVREGHKEHHSEYIQVYINQQCFAHFLLLNFVTAGEECIMYKSHNIVEVGVIWPVPYHLNHNQSHCKCQLGNSRKNISCCVSNINSKYIP